LVAVDQVQWGWCGYYYDGYPVGHVHLAAAPLLLASRLGPWLGLSGALPDQVFFVATRLVVQGLALLGLLLALLAGRRLFGWGVGLLAGLLLALNELVIIHARFEMGDVPQAALAMACLYFCARVLEDNRPRDSLLAGLCLGMAAAVKYYGGYMLLAAALAHALARPRRPRLFLLVLAGAGLGFAALTPGLLVDPPRWWADFQNELTSQSSISMLAQDQPWTWLWRGPARSFVIWAERSLIVPYLILPALALLAWRGRQPQDRLLWAATLPAVVLVVFLRAPYMRDWDHIILVPFSALVLARAAQLAWLELGKRPRWRWVLAGLLAGLLSAQAWFSLELAYRLTLPDSRQMAQAWLTQRLPPARPGQILMVDEVSESAQNILTPAYHYPQNLGYELRDDLSKLRDPPQLKTALAELDQRTPYVIFHGFHGKRGMELLEARHPPLKTWNLGEASWHNALIKLYEPTQKVLDIPFRHLGTALQEWPAWDQADTDLARREVRQLLLGTAKPVQRVLVSSRPLPLVGLLVQGRGQLRVEQGLEDLDVNVDPERPRVYLMHPSRGYPFHRHYYWFHLRARGGPVLTQLLLTRAEVAAAFLQAGEKDQALAYWRQARQAGESILPQDLYAWAGLAQAAGLPDEARQVLARLREDHAGFLAAARKSGEVGAGQPEAALKALAQGLGVDSRALAWRGLVYPWGAAGDKSGQVYQDAGSPHAGLYLPAGQAATARLSLKEPVGQPWVWARFWLKVAPGPEEKVARVELFGRFADGPWEVLGQRLLLSPGGPEYLPVDLRIKLPRLPLSLEARLHTNGRREVWASHLEILPDLPAWLADLPIPPGEATPIL
jgi:tetratricopeptide (TPR) repeat protein